jgi:type II secretory pathway pseudopilin PulG
MRRGFTRADLIITVVVVVVLVAVAMSCLVPIASLGKKYARELQDTTHQRGIGQAMWIWASNNDEKYPLPSQVDVNDTTVAELGRAKDTTANIFSILIDDGSITAHLCISPLERNKRIEAYEDYETESQTAAVDPENALWDPGFNADFTAEGGGNFSYAHLIPIGQRLDMWGTTSKADEVILSNRGPEMASVTRANGAVTTRFVSPETNTLRFAGSRNQWTGIITHNDNHVQMVDLYKHNEQVDASSDHRTLAGTEDHDVLFADEEGFESNLFLGIFTSAGETKEDYTAIWD